MNEMHPRIARRLAELRGDFVPTTEDNLRIAAENQAHDRACIAAAPNPVFTHWHQVADSVDEGTWQRIVDESPPAMRAEYVAYRPPASLPGTEARQRAALDRLRRQKPAIRTRKEQP